MSEDKGQIMQFPLPLGLVSVLGLVTPGSRGPFKAGPSDRFFRSRLRHGLHSFFALDFGEAPW
jgi:hypothetical protein